MLLKSPITRAEAHSISEAIEKVGAINVTHLSDKDRLWVHSLARLYAHPADGRIYKRTDELTGETEIVTEYEEKYRDYTVALGIMESAKDQIAGGDHVIDLIKQLWDKANFGTPPTPFI